MNLRQRFIELQQNESQLNKIRAFIKSGGLDQEDMSLSELLKPSAKPENTSQGDKYDERERPLVEANPHETTDKSHLEEDKGTGITYHDSSSGQVKNSAFKPSKAFSSVKESAFKNTRKTSDFEDDDFKISLQKKMSNKFKSPEAREKEHSGLNQPPF